MWLKKKSNCSSSFCLWVCVALTTLGVSTEASSSRTLSPRESLQYLHRHQKGQLSFKKTDNDGFSWGITKRASLGVRNGSRGSLEADHHFKSTSSGFPSFDDQMVEQVTTRAGQTAALLCIVHNIGDKQVSWIRGRDLHVLSSGLHTFATDARVSIAMSGATWTLMIHFSQPRDGGAYACQVNTQPPIASWFNLTVIEVKAIIDGPSTLYVQEGSNISLSCVIKEELVIPGMVLWYHGDALVPRDSPRIKVVTKTTEITTSQLNIGGATIADSGNYSCWPPSSGKPDRVLVHVIQGEPPAAMQHGNSSPRPSPQLRAFLTFVTWLTPYFLLPIWVT